MSVLCVGFSIAVDSCNLCDEYLIRSLVWIYDCVCLVLILFGAYMLRLGVCLLVDLGVSEVSFT